MVTAAWEPRVEEALALLVRRSKRPVVGCAPQELARFEALRGGELPAAYRRYLLRVGRDCGSFLQGSDLRFGQLDELRTSAEALLTDDRGPTLPADALVFCVHQGYQFLFFRLNGEADPAVAYYLEGASEFRVVSPRFSEWLFDAVASEFPQD